jgi:hypothetical protein
MKKFALSALGLACAHALVIGTAFAGSPEAPPFSDCARLMNAQLAKDLHSRANRAGVSSSSNDTVWVGYRAGQTGNYWKIGVGPNRPGLNTDGSWTWDSPVHGDSLQGWWPIRQTHTNVSGPTLADYQRPWWAIEAGNQANYVINQRRNLADPSAPGNRTFGVVGVWHSDPGNSGAGAGKGVGWTPLGGARSAWMGLRRHGDLTVSDPITGNAFNSNVLMFNGTNGSATGAVGTSKKFPGYGSQMDQLLYRDIDVSGAPADSGVRVSFKYSTRMSTGKGTTASTRTGWFDGDPLKIPALNDGNFISNKGVAGDPVDSFEVYVGAPAESVFLASDGTVHPIYDPLRRWFNEVIKRDARKWLFGAAGDHSASTITVAISAAEKAAFAVSGRVRLVFRVHTNRGFDDENSQVYSSSGAGAAQLDDVTADLGSGPGTIGNFEGDVPALDIDNSSATAWHSTGKPPAVVFHPHDLASLPWADLCGPPHSTQSICDMGGVVVSMGDHDHLEAAGGASGTAEEEGNWGMISPTVCLAAPGPTTPNAWDITGDMANPTEDYYLEYEIYTGIFDVFASGNLWQFMFQSYPGAQSDGVPTWGDIRLPGCVFFNPDPQCFKDMEAGRANALIMTSNANGIPDSIRIGLRRSQQCYRFGVTVGCSPTDGAYLDNMSLLLVDSPLPTSVAVNLWDWLQDTFPFNESASLPGTSGFDTTSALVRTGLNIAQGTGNIMRYDVPGDSLVAAAVGDSLRLDLVFRIRPGVGNYVTVGNPASGLRRVPTSPTAVTPGDGSFWGAYMTDPGAMASPGAAALHAAAPSGWDPLAWNSARCDSADANLFPVHNGAFMWNPDGSLWASTYHELDPHLATLGIVRNRCFLIDTSGPASEPNITCSGAAPGWLTTLPHSYTGWDGTTTTTEGTQILPDGVFTPGTSIQYFLRRQEMRNNPSGAFYTTPDTNVVYPQAGETSLDGHRWQSFNVLPDRWKDPAYGGLAMACMLVVDGDDRRGDERVWVGIADSIGATRTAARGNHNGWVAPGGADLNNPAYFVNKNAQPGTTWDLYNVKASEALTAPAGGIGSRYAFRDASPSNRVNGKYSMQGPTLAMLAAYYKILFIMTGDLQSGVLGPFRDRSSNDVKLLQDYMLGASTSAKRGVFISGNGFAESETDGGMHETMLSNYFGVTLRASSYLTFSGNGALAMDLLAESPIGSGSDIYGIRNACTATFDVLDVNPAISEAVPSAYYQPVGPNSPYVSGVYKPPVALRPWVSLVDGWDVRDLYDRFVTDSRGRLPYYYDVFADIFSVICWIPGIPGDVDVPNGGGLPRFVDYMALRNNPLRSGFTTVSFGLARADRAEIMIYDVAGRLVRRLADRTFPAGEHALSWDGTDDGGRAVGRGVYFTRVRYRNGGFEVTRRVVVLK